jgi:hypothetical protein
MTTHLEEHESVTVSLEERVAVVKAKIRITVRSVALCELDGVNQNAPQVPSYGSLVCEEKSAKIKERC